jgi:hypothetical protein
VAALGRLRGEPVVAAIKFEMPFRCEVIKIPAKAAFLQYCEKLLCLKFATSAKERFGGLKPSPANELNVDVTGGVERRRLGFVDEETITRNASGEKLDAQKLQRLIAFSLVGGDQRLNEPADFWQIRSDRNKTEAAKQLIFVHSDVEFNEVAAASHWRRIKPWEGICFRLPLRPDW